MYLYIFLYIYIYIYIYILSPDPRTRAPVLSHSLFLAFACSLGHARVLVENLRFQSRTRDIVTHHYPPPSCSLSRGRETFLQDTHAYTCTHTLLHIDMHTYPHASGSSPLWTHTHTHAHTLSYTHTHSCRLSVGYNSIGTKTRNWCQTIRVK